VTAELLTAVLPVAWGLLALAAVDRRRPAPARVCALRGPAAPLAPGVGPSGRRPGTAPAGRAADRRLRLAGAAVGAGLALLVWPPLVVVAGLACWGLPRWQQRSARRRHDDQVRRDLPEIVDLTVLAVGAGLTVPLAVAAVARRGHGPVAGALGQVLDEVALGRRLADALDDVPARVGEAVRPLTAALAASDRYGAPLLDALDRLSAEARADRRRRAEEAARRIPVKLLFPLVACILPAFALLTVAPLLAGALGALRP
jgi:tight adherence protein C